MSRQPYLLIGMLAGMLNVIPLTPAQAEPIDTHDYGFLNPGMPASEVVNRVGEPDQKAITQRLLIRVRGGGLVEQIEEGWLYKGNGQVMRTILVFRSGILQSKTKTQEP